MILKKKIKRELPIMFDRREWMVEIEPWGLHLWAKRTHQKFPITWDSILNKTMDIAAQQAKREKAEKRKLKKLNRL